MRSKQRESGARAPAGTMAGIIKKQILKHLSRSASERALRAGPLRWPPGSRALPAAGGAPRPAPLHESRGGWPGLGGPGSPPE